MAKWKYSNIGSIDVNTAILCVCLLKRVLQSVRSLHLFRLYVSLMRLSVVQKNPFIFHRSNLQYFYSSKTRIELQIRQSFLQKKTSVFLLYL